MRSAPRLTQRKGPEAQQRFEAMIGNSPCEVAPVSQLTTTKVTQGNVIDLREFITVRDQAARTTSLKVAEAFGRNHYNVLKAIKHLDSSDEFNGVNFNAIGYTDSRGRQKPAYEMTKDGFIFLVMGFTSAKAAAIKEAYIAAFNWMAEQLEQKDRGLWDTTIGTDGVHVLGELVGKKVRGLPKGIQHSARMTLWSRLHTRFNVARAELIPADQMDAAANFLAAYVYEGIIEDKGAQASMRPVVFTKPHQHGEPDGAGLPRTEKAMKAILWQLREWGHENLPRGEVSESFDAAVMEVERLQVTCWTEIDESLMRLKSAQAYIGDATEMLNRWQDRGGRIGNVG